MIQWIVRTTYRRTHYSFKNNKQDKYNKHTKSQSENWTDGIRRKRNKYLLGLTLPVTEDRLIYIQYWFIALYYSYTQIFQWNEFDSYNLLYQRKDCTLEF